MGFNLYCAIARCDHDAQAEEIAAAARAQLTFTRARVFRAPFLGVLAGYDHYKQHEAWERAPASFGFADEDEAHERILEGIERQLPSLSRAFPAVRFACVEVDCFGGVCHYDGSVFENGEQRFRLPQSSADGHQILFAQMGLPDLPAHFAPFARGFLDGAPPPDEIRRGIEGAVRGVVHDFSTAGLRLLLDGNQTAWRTQLVGETLILTCGADDLVISANPRGRELALDGRSHLAPAPAKAQLDALFAAGLEELECELELFDRSGKSIHRWPARVR